MYILALLMNFISSYLLASVFGSFLLVFLIFFALIILNIEILSLFNAINALNVFIFCILNLVLSCWIFKYKKANCLKISFDFKRFLNSFKLDKSLIFLAISFVFMLFVSFCLGSIMPVVEPDAQTYHFLRAYEFVKNGSLSHFETNDIRALVMPINSEIFYAWQYALKQNFFGYGLLSFLSFLSIILSSWSILEKFKISFRKRLWAIFIFSSLCSVIVQISSMQTDIVVGSLLLLSLALFVFCDKKMIYFSSLALSIAFGVKTTALMASLGFVLLLFIYESFIDKNRKFEKMKLFLPCLILNFIVFSSYNYILNFIQFENFISSRPAYLGHAFWGGFKGWISNIIHFIFQSFDFTGFKWGYYINYKLLALKNSLYEFINISPRLGCNVPMDRVNITTDEQVMGFGILGFLVFLPTIFYSIFKIFNSNNSKIKFLAMLGSIFILNVLILARAMAYMVYSIRFVLAFVCLSFLVLVFSYSKKSIYKAIILFFAIFYMTLIPLNIRRMPVYAIVDNLVKNSYDINKFVYDCFDGKVLPCLTNAMQIKKTILEKYPKAKKIAFFRSLQIPVLYLKTLEKDGRVVDFLNAGNLTKEKLQNYDLVILEDKTQQDNVFNYWEIDENYSINDKEVHFKKDDNKINCVYMNSSTNMNDEFEACERMCFTYDFLIKNKNFKKDFQQSIELKAINSHIDIFYFKRGV